MKTRVTMVTFTPELTAAPVTFCKNPLHSSMLGKENITFFYLKEMR